MNDDAESGSLVDTESESTLLDTRDQKKKKKRLKMLRCQLDQLKATEISHMKLADLMYCW